jgi:hypothetical protein
MAAGAPRTVSLPPEEMKKLGKEMIAWIEANNPFHLSEWYTIEKMFTYKQWKAMIQRPEFLPYYEKSLKMVGRRYLNGDVNSSIANRWQRVYFNDLKEQEDTDLDAQAERNAKANKANGEIVESAAAILEAVKRDNKKK